jgi:ubiquinone/menaquinone biosynthesis C-methylase UbiE
MALDRIEGGAMKEITVDAVRRCLAAHVPLYAWRKPVYQHVALRNLQRLWNPAHRSALDVGGGTGVMAQAVKTLFGLQRVVSVDVADRFLPSLNVETSVYDGSRLPFGDGSFDCILLFNVLHHVPVNARGPLLRECRRVAGVGPIYIKDHVSQGHFDDLRLAALDLLGNLPFSGMVRAWYLRECDWEDLAAKTNHQTGVPLCGPYRQGFSAALFPNRLEVSMRWCPA